MNDQNLNAVVSGELLPTKANAAIIAHKIVKACEEGETDPLQTWARLIGVEETIKAAKEGIKESCIKELEKHKGGTSILSAKMEKIEAGTKYDYSGCPVWRELKATSDAAAADLKDRETYLKGVKKEIHETNPDTGEVRIIYPPTKTSTEAVKITLAKE